MSGIPYRKALLEMIEDLALRGCGDEEIALPLVDAVMDLHPHLQGPAYVQIDAADKSALTKRVDILDTVGIYGVEISKSTTTLVAACRAITELVEIASWYKVETVHRQATKTLRRFPSETTNRLPDSSCS